MIVNSNIWAFIPRVKTDFDKWKPINASLTGRVYSIKMKVLSRVLYLFQCLPVFLQLLFFTTLDKHIISLLWDGKQPRRSKVYKDIGLKLDFLFWYYWAANIEKTIDWFNLPEEGWCLNHDHLPLALVTSRSPFSKEVFIHPNSNYFIKNCGCFAHNLASQVFLL